MGVGGREGGVGCRGQRNADESRAFIWNHVHASEGEKLRDLMTKHLPNRKDGHHRKDKRDMEVLI